MSAAVFSREAALLRRWISMFAIWGLLLHAGLLVQHNSVMLNAHLAHGSLLNDLHVLCAQQGTATLDADSLPHVPRPAETQQACPICSGLVAAVVLASPCPEFICIGTWQTHEHLPIQSVDATRVTSLRLPPARGPPLA
jgi:hypothetical protein